MDDDELGRRINNRAEEQAVEAMTMVFEALYKDHVPGEEDPDLAPRAMWELGSATQAIDPVVESEDFTNMVAGQSLALAFRQFLREKDKK